jgi:hypothetical protein
VVQEVVEVILTSCYYETVAKMMKMVVKMMKMMKMVVKSFHMKGLRVLL